MELGASRPCHKWYSKAPSEKWASSVNAKHLLICSEKSKRHNRILEAINIDIFLRWSPFPFVMCFYKCVMEYRTKFLINYLEKFPRLRLLMEIRIEMYFEYTVWYPFAAHWISYFDQVNINIALLFASIHVEGRKSDPRGYYDTGKATGDTNVFWIHTMSYLMFLSYHYCSRAASQRKCVYWNSMRVWLELETI